MKQPRNTEALGFSASKHVQDMYLHYLRRGARTYSFEFMIIDRDRLLSGGARFTVSIYRKLAEGRVIIAGITELCPVVGFDINTAMQKLTYLGRVEEDEKQHIEERLRKLIVQLYSAVVSDPRGDEHHVAQE